MDAETTSGRELNKYEPPSLSHVGDRIPNALSPAELARVLNIGARNFYNFQAAGKFKRFELKNPIGRKRYSGVLVARHLAGGGGK